MGCAHVKTKLLWTTASIFGLGTLNQIVVIYATVNSLSIAPQIMEIEAGKYVLSSWNVSSQIYCPYMRVAQGQILQLLSFKEYNLYVTLFFMILVDSAGFFDR